MYTVRTDGSENIEASAPLTSVASPLDGVLVDSMKWSRDSSALTYAEVAYECDIIIFDGTRLTERQATPDGLGTGVLRDTSTLPTAVWSD